MTRTEPTTAPGGIVGTVDGTVDGAVDGAVVGMVDRRAVLAATVATAGVAIAGCTSAPPPAPDRLAPALTRLIADERAILAAYDAAIAAFPELKTRLTRPRANHAEHVRALSAVLTQHQSASPAPSASRTAAAPKPSADRPNSASSARKALAADESKLATSAGDTCMLTNGPVAALLASVSASHACHAEVI